MYNGHVYNTFICYRGGTESGLLGKSIYSDLLHFRTEDNDENLFQPFFAPISIPKGADFKEAVRAVLADVKCFIMILDKGFFDACSEPDDIVYFEISTALKKKDITFLPIIMNGYNINQDESLAKVFNKHDVERLKHINGVNYHGIYDFNTELDVIPVLIAAMNNKIGGVTDSSDVLVLNMADFRLAKGNVVTFGSYPKSVVNDVNLIDKISAGIFNGETVLDSKTKQMVYCGQRFATLTENPFNKSTFDDGRALSGGSRNYFSVQPITWLVIFENDDYQVLLSERLIDAVKFNLNRVSHRTESNDCISANNWEYSYIRRWLNNDFLYDAFTPDEQDMIMMCEVDNGPDSSFYCHSAVNNTKDKIFLISHKEIYMTDFGCAKATDYAKAHGAYSSTSASHTGHGDWWTRSQGNMESSVENVDRRGCVDAVPFCNYVDDTAAGVRPMLVRKKR